MPYNKGMKKDIKTNEYYWNIFALSYFSGAPYKCFVASRAYSETEDLEDTIKDIAELCGEQRPHSFMKNFYKHNYPLGEMIEFQFHGFKEAREDDDFFKDFKSFYYARYVWKNMPFSWFPCFFIAEFSKKPNSSSNLV